MRRRFLSDVRALASRALAHGGTQLSPLQVVWPMAYDCENPYTTEVWGVSSRPKDGTPIVVRGVHMSVLMETRCRKCAACITARRRLWQMRAEAETRLWPRTWFGTITLRPEDHYLMELRASSEKRKRAVPWDELSEAEQFAAIDREVYKQLTLMWKRIRASYGHEMRFLCVTERHASGLPHYHALVHQCVIGEPLKYSHLEGQWPHGFTKWRLVKSAREASYVCKYLNKSAAARVRASQAYGNYPLEDRVGFNLTRDYSILDNNIENMTTNAERDEGNEVNAISAIRTDLDERSELDACAIRERDIQER